MIGLGNSVVKRKIFAPSVPAAPVNVVLPSLTGTGLVGSTITCNKGTWTGVPTPTYIYDFKVGGITAQTGPSNTYVPTVSDDGKAITCEVTATNTQGSSSATTSNSITVGTAPVNTVAPVVSGSTSLGDTLTTTDGTFTGTAPIIYTYQWKRNGVDIIGQISSTYVIGSSDSLAAITCEVKGTNTYGFDTAISNTVTVDNFAPVNTVAPTVSPSGTQSTGTLITVSVGTWTGLPTITYEYRWTRNGSPISGAVNTTYTIQAADDGTTIRCEVRGTNSYGVSSYVASSNSVSAVNAVAPVNTVAPVISGTAVVGQTLSSTTGTWTGTPTPTFSYQWRRGGVDIGGATSSTYTLVSADAGQNITCVVTATNTAGSASATSNTISVFLTMLDKYPMYNGYSASRLLRGAYYGSAIIRLRRSNDNAESNFGVTTSGLLDEAAITSWVGANNAFVVTLYAQDGSTRHFTQSTPLEQPQFVSAGVIIKRTGAGVGAEARPAMDFSGTQSLIVSSSTSLYNFIHNGTSSYVYGVAEFGKVADPNALYALIGNYAVNGSNIGFTITYDDRASVPLNNATRIQVANGLGANAITSINNNSLSPQQVCIYTSQFDADNSTAANRSISRINNGAALQGNTQTVAPSTSNSSFNLQLGGAGNNTFRLVGFVSEMCIDNTNQSSNDANIRTDLNSFYRTF